MFSAKGIKQKRFYAVFMCVYFSENRNKIQGKATAKTKRSCTPHKFV